MYRVSAVKATLAEKVRAYILNVEQFISKVNVEELESNQERILELARSYLSDAKYYYEEGDYITSLACIAYAEGLLDSLRVAGYVKGIEWRPLSELLKRPKVLVTGSFELIHPGHLALLREAWKLGEVYVIVSRDKNFERFKGRKPVLSENDRLEVVRGIKYVSKAILGDENDLLKPLEDLKPDIVLLGPDQWIQPEELSSRLKERGLSSVKVLRLEKRVGEWSSSSILNRIKNGAYPARSP
ncbi:MAG: DUF357 domain-containing protein [Desulfurococcaceae archaeon]